MANRICRKRILSVLIAFTAAICAVTGCSKSSAPDERESQSYADSEEGQTASGEIDEKEFAEQLDYFDISLIADGEAESGFSFASEDAVSSILSKYNIGSEAYESLVQANTSKQLIPSSAETKNVYTLSGGDVVENLYLSSTADQVPNIYLINGNTLFDTGKCSNVCGLVGDSADSITIRNCVFENMSGINLTNCSNVIIENCYFKGAENGIHLIDCNYVTIRNCTFEMNATGLTDYYQGVYLGDGNEAVAVSNCYFRADGDIKKPFRIGSTANDSKPSENVVFESCVAEGYFRDGFQNIEGEALLSYCIFVFREDEGCYDSPVIVDADSYDSSYTELQNCEIYSEYRKPISTTITTEFKNCSFGLI